MQKENTDKKQREKFLEELVESVTNEFEARRKERLQLERQWELNLNFLSGNQYVSVDGRGELFEENREYFWQHREVFNHISTIIDSRLAKFSKINPVLTVRPKTDSDSDAIDAEVSEKLLSFVRDKCDLHNVIRQATAWSETCGTAFYKTVWQNSGGVKIGEVDGKSVHEGSVSVIAVSPFEIYPENLYTELISDQADIIHAKAVSVDEVKRLYGVDVQGEEIGVYGVGKEKNFLKSAEKSVRKNSVIVIEKYEKPTPEYPEGRLITVAGGKLLYYGVLPYKNGIDQTRDYPFIKQESFKNIGMFFGKSIIEKLIPIQRAYNAVKNRKHEFLNRLTAGVMTVEDGSLDVDDLAEEGLSPGKVLVYRQGAKAPEIMPEPTLPSEFSDEENKLLDEFVTISGTSDLNSSSENAGVTSGTALEILIEQDNERLSFQAENIRKCFVEIAKQILRLFSQHSSSVRRIISNAKNKTEISYIKVPSIPSDDVVIDSENELGQTKAQRRDAILRLYESGLLANSEGEISNYVKEKILSLLGYSDLDSRKGISRLHEEKAQSENEEIRNKGKEIEIIDDDAIHEFEHTRYILSEYNSLTNEEKERLFSHVESHRERAKQIKNKN